MCNSSRSDAAQASTLHCMERACLFYTTSCRISTRTNKPQLLTPNPHPHRSKSKSCLGAPAPLPTYLMALECELGSTSV